MSEQNDVPADSKAAVEKDVVNDDATSSIAQACVDTVKVDFNVSECTDRAISEVPSASTKYNNAESKEMDSHPIETTLNSEPTSFIQSNLRTDNAEVGHSQELTSGSPSSLDPALRSNTGSEDGSDFKDTEVSKRGGQDVSDSESQAGSESSSEGIRTGRRNRRASNELSKDNYSDDDSLGKEDGEYEPQGARESGDGEEKTKDKAVDRDEDKKDPQYIPKKGVFYEHDDRTADSGPVNVEEEPTETKKKKVVADKIDRWGHDMFDTVKQSPKSTQDLIDYYGYDIRNEEEPPKAWRSRRYGRGPNKYTRQWQDEAAYRNKRPQSNKPPPPAGPFKNNIEDFPTVEQSKSGYRKTRNKNLNNSRGSGSRERGRSLNKTQSPKEHRSEPRKKVQPETPTVMHSSSVQPLLIEDDSLPNEEHFKENTYKDIQIEKTVFLNKKKPFSAAKTKSEAEAEADLAALSKEFSNAVINLGRDGKILPIRAHTTTAGPTSSVHRTEKEEMTEMRAEPHAAIHHIPSGGGETRVKERRDTSQNAVSSSKSKRYSSQRQRSLPQSNHLQQQAPPQQTQQQQQQFLHQQQFYPPPPQSAPETVPDPALFSNFQGNPPPVFTEPMQSVVFLPGYPPTPPPHLLNYCPPPQQFGMPPPLGPPPPELFPPQPPPGITYYSPQNQVQPRPPASRRVKVAIPIVAPPDQSQSDQTCS